MPRVMRDLDFKIEERRDLVRLGIPFLALLIVPLLLRQEWGYWIAMFAAPPLALAGLFRTLRRHRRRPCARCRAPMRRHEPGRDRPIRFFCPACDVVWDVGRYETSD